MQTPFSAGFPLQVADRGTTQPDRSRQTFCKPRSPVRHIPSLDGIRAVSFLLVFVGHAGAARYVPTDLGVTTFFFLSGFLITTLMRSEFERMGSVSLAHFWLRRALRILPPLYLVVLAATLVALKLYPAGTVCGQSVPAALLFYANYWHGCGVHGEAPGTGVVWSLAVEEHFYLLFPLLYVGMQRCHLPRPVQAGFLWGLCAAVLVWRCVLVLAMHSSSARIYISTDTRIDSILFGCALALWHNPALDDSPRASNAWKYVVLPAALLTLLGSCTYFGAVFRHTGYFTVQGLALTPIFICAVRYPRAPLFRILNYRPVAYIGVLSYSLYLTHDVLIHAAVRLWPELNAWQRAIVALTSSLFVAWLIYVMIEKPCARLRKRLAV